MYIMYVWMYDLYDGCGLFLSEPESLIPWIRAQGGVCMEQFFPFRSPYFFSLFSSVRIPTFEGTDGVSIRA